MTALIIGLGSIGRRHARNLKRLNPAIRLTGCRTRATTLDDLGDDAALFDAVEFDLTKAIQSPPTIGIVATPASRHVADARRLADAGVHVFVEKPLSDRLDGAQELIDECHQRSLCLMVGYNLRFDAALRATRAAVTDGRIGRVLAIRTEVGQYLPDWRPGRDYRETVSAQANLGGGPLLELSHEFDYVRWLAGDVRTVTAQVGTLGDLAIDVPDVADVLVECESGARGVIHLDMLDRAKVRRCRVVGTEGTIMWDALARSAMLFATGMGEWLSLEPGGAGHAGADTYLAEMEHLLEVAAGRPSVAANGNDALEALRIAVAARESAATGRTIAL